MSSSLSLLDRPNEDVGRPNEEVDRSNEDMSPGLHQVPHQAFTKCLTRPSPSVFTKCLHQVPSPGSGFGLSSPGPGIGLSSPGIRHACCMELQAMSLTHACPAHVFGLRAFALGSMHVPLNPMHTLLMGLGCQAMSNAKQCGAMRSNAQVDRTRRCREQEPSGAGAVSTWVVEPRNQDLGGRAKAAGMHLQWSSMFH